MDTNTKFLGTSLDILKSYPLGGLFGAKVQCPHGIGTVEQLRADHQFAGDNALQDAAGVWEGEPGETRRLRLYRMRELTLLARPFSALTVPLPSGEVPALILAKIAVPEVECVRAEIVNAGFGQYHCVCYGPQGQHYYAIHRNNFESVRGSKVENRLDGELTDKLREMRFALPVNGKPLVPHVDYIPLS